MNELSTRLKRLREQFGERQAQFAERFGVDQSTYNRWETGERSPTKVGLALIKRVLAEIRRHGKRK